VLFCRSDSLKSSQARDDMCEHSRGPPVSQQEPPQNVPRSISLTRYFKLLYRARAASLTWQRHPANHQMLAFWLLPSRSSFEIFQPSVYRPQQSVCSQPDCQRRRRSDYHRERSGTTPPMAEDVRRVRRNGSRRNRDYWKNIGNNIPRRPIATATRNGHAIRRVDC